jgi:hypothetical protein
MFEKQQSLRKQSSNKKEIASTIEVWRFLFTKIDKLFFA